MGYVLLAVLKWPFKSNEGHEFVALPPRAIVVTFGPGWPVFQPKLDNPEYCSRPLPYLNTNAVVVVVVVV